MGLHGPETIGQHSPQTIYGPTLNGKGAVHTGPARGKSTYKARGLSRSDKVEIPAKPILTEWSVRDFPIDEVADVHGKKKKTKVTNATIVVAGFQPHRAQ